MDVLAIVVIGVSVCVVAIVIAVLSTAPRRMRRDAAQLVPAPDAAGRAWAENWLTRSGHRFMS